MTSCCNEYGTCRQSDDCPARTGVVLPHQAAHARRVARIKSSTPKFADVVPPEAGNFQIVDLGPDDNSTDNPLTHDEAMALVRSLLSWLLVVVVVVAALALAVSYSTEAHADVLWAFLQGVA